MKTKKLIPASVMALAASMMLFVACNKDKPEVSNNNNPATAPGEFKVHMTDAPGDYASFKAQITKVEAYHENDGWITLNSESKIVSVLDLNNGKSIELAHASNLSAGTYTKLKLTFGDANYISFNAGVNTSGITLNAQGEALLQWDGPKEVEITINENMNAQTGAFVLLDFHAANSLHQQASSYVINPVITEIKDVSTGLKGTVQGHARAAIMLSSGTHTYSTYINAQGQFLMRGIEPGIYQLTVIPSGVTPGGLSEHEVNGIVVTKGQIKQVGTIHL
ncbi:MAG TPA: DUF4382 domain-containing protein [Flavobacteriales bacterium]|nr:DUF4382 domain-containing protein [Flavobacteriales bacterium]